MKPIAMIIDKTDFRDETYFIPKALFAEQGIEVKTVSQGVGMCLGVFGGVAMADTAINQIKPADFGFIIFAKSEGAGNLQESEDSKRLKKEAEQANTPVFFISSPEQSRKIAQVVIDKLRAI